MPTVSPLAERPASGENPDAPAARASHAAPDGRADPPPRVPPSGQARPRPVIVLLHVATGALAGELAGSRAGAAVLGPLLHAALDVVPHEDIPSRRFEAAGGVAAVLLLAARRGVDPATVGAVASAAPDLEHVLPLPRPGGMPLFPSHRRPHRAAGRVVPAAVQLALAAGILGALVARGRRPARASAALP